MIGYVTLGTNDLARAARFYDALLGELGAQRFFESERYIAWRVSADAPSLVVTLPYDGQPATIGNGAMVALLVDDPAKVDALHKKALELGARDEGAPGTRNTGAYVAYFRDLDGNKLNFISMKR